VLATGAFEAKRGVVCSTSWRIASLRLCALCDSATAPPQTSNATTTCIKNTALRDNLAAHQADAQQHFDALHLSQKQLTANLRALLNALDSLMRLAAPRPEAAAMEQLRAVVGGARALQARLKGVAGRLDRAEAVLAGLLAKQQQQQQQQQQ